MVFFFHKSEANFEFLAKTGLVPDLFLKAFLYILRVSEISFQRNLFHKIGANFVFWWWILDGVQLFGSSNLIIIIWYMYRRFGFFGGDLLPDPPKPNGILGTPRAPSYSRGP